MSASPALASARRTAKDVLRPLRNRVAGLLYDRSTRYTLRLDGRRTVFSTEDPAAHRWFYPRYAFNRLHEKPVTRLLVDDLRTASCFADVGANLGYYSCLATQFMAAGEIHAFEMDRDNFALLEGNLALNHAVATPYANNVAVSDHAGSVRYSRRPDLNHPALSLYNPWPGEGEVEVEVPAITLDDYFADRPKPDVLKMDIEGAEVDALRGMTTLLPDLRRLYLEVHPENLALAGQSPSDALALLAPHFRIFVISGHRAQGAGHLTEIDPTAPLGGNSMLLATRD
ncbi:FkbM family methyltransferase [Nocardioides terrisoli]|uniref:FkbM family methyltransferase n=1 Tax=Nocardioides terrisoli TaxID=3388267 RepID=UPI00287B98D8|nr:FkbM family methyltransferase [Nocardioides marmorisolisilvae]